MENTRNLIIIDFLFPAHIYQSNHARGKEVIPFTQSQCPKGKSGREQSRELLGDWCELDCFWSLTAQGPTNRMEFVELFFSRENK